MVELWIFFCCIPIWLAILWHIVGIDIEREIKDAQEGRV